MLFRIWLVMITSKAGSRVDDGNKFQNWYETKKRATFHLPRTSLPLITPFPLRLSRGPIPSPSLLLRWTPSPSPPFFYCHLSIKASRFFPDVQKTSTLLITNDFFLPKNRFPKKNFLINFFYRIFFTDFQKILF